MYVDALLISERKVDLEFFRSFQASSGFTFASTLDPEKIHDFQASNRRGLMFCDLDLLVQGRVAGLDPARTWVLCNGPLMDVFQVTNPDQFSGVLVRRFDAMLNRVLKALISATGSSTIFGLAAYAGQVPVQRIEIAESQSRRLVTEAVNRVLQQRGMAPRVVSSVSRSVDELLMNAIYDAPVMKGARYRRETPRDFRFEMKGHEQVSLEMAATPDFLAVNVIDRFGSLKYDLLCSYLKNDYSSADYKARASSESAGLGVLDLLGSGLSLVYATESKQRTEAMLFVPWVKTYRDFRTASQFFGFLRV